MRRCTRIDAPASFELWRIDLGLELTEAELGLLSADEQERAARFAFAHGRRRFRAARVALRRLLAASTGQLPHAIEFANGPFGKPHLLGNAACAFNLSDSADVALVAIASEGEVGVDVEVLRVVDDCLDLARRNFTGSEYAELGSLTIEARHRAFLRCWTRKEACLKAIGSGLSIPPESFSAGLTSLPCITRIATPSGTVSVEVHSIDAGDDVVGALAWVRQPR
jgi:4'-phosphopantetheinyl transferase